MTVKCLQQVMKDRPRLPIFGICLGHQLLSLAAGCKTYKMKFGNRGVHLDKHLGNCIFCGSLWDFMAFLMAVDGSGHALCEKGMNPAAMFLFATLCTSAEEPALHRSANWQMLHHIAESWLCCGWLRSAWGMALSFRQCQRWLQRGHRTQGLGWLEFPQMFW